MDVFLPQPLIFEWDKGNDLKSLEKHGVTLAESEQIFFNKHVMVYDTVHSNGEKRFQVIGKTDIGKVLFIAFTIRDKKIRVISARLADRRERMFYDN